MGAEEKVYYRVRYDGNGSFLRPGPGRWTYERDGAARYPTLMQAALGFMAWYNEHGSDGRNGYTPDDFTIQRVTERTVSQTTTEVEDL